MKVSAENHFNNKKKSMMQGDFDSAIASFTKAIKCDPMHAIAYRGRAF
jgi:Tfp pilus assembly protein PilF